MFKQRSNETVTSDSDEDLKPKKLSVQVDLPKQDQGQPQTVRGEYKFWCRACGAYHVGML